MSTPYREQTDTNSPDNDVQLSGKLDLLVDDTVGLWRVLVEETVPAHLIEVMVLAFYHRRLAQLYPLERDESYDEADWDNRRSKP